MSPAGIIKAGVQYLDHLLSPEQIALCRVVTCDAGRFPELGRIYQENVAQGRSAILSTYLARVVN